MIFRKKPTPVPAEGFQPADPGRRMAKIRKFLPFYLMFLPVLVYYILFHYLPMYGLKIAFYDYGLFGVKGFIGLQNFQDLLTNPKFWEAFRNTLVISGGNLVLGMTIALILSLLVNELRNGPFKKITQTIVYLPHFLSWVVVASIFTMLLSPDNGVINAVIQKAGGQPIYFLVSEKWWTPIFLFMYRWKETGWGTVIFLAALSSVDPGLYEAAWIDGASRLRQVWHITLPSIRTTILAVFILNLASVLNLLDSVFVMLNPLILSVGEVIDTYTYRTGMVNHDYDYATAVGLFKSIISLGLVLWANWLSKRVSGESIL
jgi:putative aldouronate transport system permease protein